MSTITSAFHTYGLLITEEAATRILQHVKETAPDLYRDFSEAEDVPAFQEYLCDRYNGYQYGTVDYMTVWRIKDHEEIDMKPVDEFYILELCHFPQLFSQAYTSYEEIIQEFQARMGGLLPSNFPFDDFLVEIMGEVWG